MKTMTAIAIALAASAALPAMAAGLPSMAEPALSADGRQIAFVSGGDIWEVPASGGIARLLVTDGATESRPFYAPGGKHLAFASTRGGNANIHVMDLTTGEVRRISFAEANEEPSGWSADGKYLYFTTGAHDVGRQPDIYRVAASGGTPMPVSAERFLAEVQGAPSPDGASIALVARSGMAQNQWWRNGHAHIDENEIWTRSMDSGTYRQLLADGAKHAWPMWTPGGDALYFMSDKSGAENLWMMPANGGAARQVTGFTDGRLLFPAMAQDGSAIVFERDFGIWRLDLASGKAAQVPITLRGAPAGEGPRSLTLTSFDRLALSPDGSKAAVLAHGELFAAGTKDGGPAQRITNSVTAEREMTWSPDSRRLLYVTERGMDRLVAEHDLVSGKSQTLTEKGLAAALAYAPDGKRAAYVSDDSALHVLTLPRPGQAASDRVVMTGALETDEGGTRPVWSPDGQWLAVPVRDRRSFVNLMVVPAAGGAARPISFLGNGRIGMLAWSPDGRALLFDTAQRSEPSRIVRVDLVPAVPKFREDAFRALFQPQDKPDTAPTDTLADKPADSAEKPAAPAGAAAAKAGAKPAAGPAKPPAPVNIVFEGIRERVTILPLGLNAEAPVISSDGKLLVFRARERGQENLYAFNLDELASEPPVPQQLTATSRPKPDFALAADGKTLFYLDGGTITATPSDALRPRSIAVSASMDVDFDAEKQVVFDQAWGTLNRQFFDSGFHGKDWTAIRARFQPQVTGARNGDELRRILNLMQGELNASHMGISRAANGPGAPPTDRTGQLGLGFDRAAAENGKGLIVDSVLALGPAGISGKIRIGDRLASIGGRAVDAGTNIDALLQRQVGRQVVLGMVTPTGQRDVTVRPVSASSIAGVRYREWVAGRRAYVERISGGRLGYVHMADMGDASLAQLYLDLDSGNQGREGVVIDIRNNNGGYVHSYALDAFSRRNFLTLESRDRFPVPGRQALGQRALDLPTVLVINEGTLSDGEDFTEGYRALGLGKVVGQPTAGWIIFTGGERLIDGSTVRTPGARVRTLKGEDMEMRPRPVDIVVTRPLGDGDRDAQLDAAITALTAQLPRK